MTTTHGQFNGAAGPLPRGHAAGGFAGLIGLVSRRLLGEPNKGLSSTHELRFGTHGSLSVDLAKGTFFDHEACKGGGVLDLIEHKTGLTGPARSIWLHENGFRSDVIKNVETGSSKLRRKIVAVHRYTDAAGNTIFEVVRHEPKRFSLRRSDGYGGWHWNMDGVEFFPYRLPELLRAIANQEPVFIPEGEKDCDNLARIGIVATCNHGGAGKWKAKHAEYLKGGDVIIIPDNDDAGRKHAESVARSLQGIARRVRILELPDLAPKGDVSDWIARGGSAERLRALAEQAPKWQPAPTTRARDSLQPRNATLSDPVLSEADLSGHLVDRHRHSLRYVSAWGKTVHFDGKVWKVESTQLARDFARKLCQEFAADCDDKDRVRIASSKTIAGVQTLAQAHRDIAATVDQWDANPWLLNTPGGVVDLRTGEMRGHCPDDHLTKITAVAPGGMCPLWLEFLARIFAKDVELISYVQRVMGYGLTGSTREHSMFFGYGTGGNGKSVLLDTSAGIMGDYHTTAPIETFTLSTGDRHPTELARLIGARLVTAVETEEGRRWAETRIKTLTGGDRVAARFMRQDFFEFKPQFKLLIVGNHKPALRTVDEAIRRRFNLIPFAVTIPKDERDGTLGHRLKAEWSGILQWMIDGCLDWQERGLAPPAAVTDATNQYLEAEDAIAAWIEECCDVHPNNSDGPAVLFASWKTYAERTGETAGSLKSFGPKLEGRGYHQRKSNGQRLYQGLKVRPYKPETPHWSDREATGSHRVGCSE